MKFIVVLISLFICASVLGQHQHPSIVVKTATLESGLGAVNHPVSTASAEAQQFFNQGLAYTYAFNHDEAVRSFKRAAELDPKMAMAYWGIALALGSNYNLQADAPQLKEAYANVQKALALVGKSPEPERAYIEALSKRYSGNTQGDLQKLAVDYKNAMGELVKRYPDDLDAATLYAESMMNLRPWKLWTKDGKPAEGTEEIVTVLESVLRRNPNHTGANHYYIHAVEASLNPERAMSSAMRLGKLAPKAGHLVHMPSHIYIRTGDYDEAAKSNIDAIAADREYIAKTNAQGVYPMMYYNHNIHFLASANAMKGRYADAIKSARELEASVKPHVKMMPMLEMFSPYPIVTLVRFHKWDEVLKMPKPDAKMKITTSFWHFARGMAYAGRGQTNDAEMELRALQSIYKTIPADAPFGNNVAVDVLQVAKLTLAGRIALASNKETGIELLRKAITAEDIVGYNEPPDWDLPVRELLGGALLVNKGYAEAEKVFRDELTKHPRNGRALFGLIESLKGQGKEASAKLVGIEFEKAWETADTKLSIEDLYDGKPNSEKTSSSTQSLQFGNVQLSTGVRLRYAEQGNPTGLPVIMLHGYTDSWFSYSRVLPLLDAKKYRVFVLDQRGHGDSERPAKGYNIPDFAADVVAFMDAKKIKRAIVVGHSMGSFVAQEVALSVPERVTGLVLIGSASTIKNNSVLGLEKDIRALKDKVPETFAREFQLSTIYHSVPDEFLNRVVAESLKIPANTWREIIAGLLSPAYNPRLNNIKSPTLILWGDKETVFPRKEQDMLVSAIKNSNLKVYAETGHALHWERPEQFVQDFEKFIADTKLQ